MKPIMEKHMKKIICLTLASAMLCASVPATFAEDKKIALDPASSLYIEDGYIENLRENCTAAELIAEFADRDSLTVTDRDGNALALTDKVGAATVSNGSDFVKTYLPGDVNEDSGVSSKDVSFLLRSQAGFGTDICRKASDVNNDGSVNAKDAAQLMKYLAGWDVSLAKTYAGIAAEYDDPGIDWFFDSVMHRVGRSDTTLYGTKDYVARMAKNEIEDVQLLITSDEHRSGLTVEVGALTNASGTELAYEFLVGYYYDSAIFRQAAGGDASPDNTVYDFFTDPLPEYRGEAFDIGADNSKSFVMRVNSDADTEAGLYKAVAVLRDADAREIKKMEFRVYVWDFALPETPASATAFHLSYPTILSDQGDLNYINNVMTDDDRLALYERWYEYLLDQRISAYYLPADIQSPEADKWMSDPRVTSFCETMGTAYGGSLNRPDEMMVRDYEKLRTNPDWLDKAYIYTVDEPWGEGGLQMVVDQYEWAKRIIPEGDFHIIVPLADDLYFKDFGGIPTDSAQIVAEHSDILCPQSYFFTTYYPIDVYKLDKSVKPKGTKCATDAHICELYGQFTDRWAQWRAEGKKMWWYVCIMPGFPHANFFTYYQGICARILMWQQYMFDVDGLLYYSTMRPNMVNRRAIGDYGDGILLFSGTMFGQESYPVSSVRLEQIRDGLEDFDYLKLLEGFDGRKEVMTYVNRLTTDVLYYTEDYAFLDSVRDEVGFLLESLGAK